MLVVRGDHTGGEGEQRLKLAQLSTGMVHSLAIMTKSSLFGNGPTTTPSASTPMERMQPVTLCTAVTKVA